MIVHNFDPVLVDLGFFQIRWYSIAYILGIILGWVYAVKIIKPLSVNTITYLEPTTGVILGFLVLNENLRINQLVGFFIILAVGILQIINDSKPKSQES